MFKVLLQIKQAKWTKAITHEFVLSQDGLYKLIGRYAVMYGSPIEHAGHKGIRLFEYYNKTGEVSIMFSNATKEDMTLFPFKEKKESVVQNKIIEPKQITALVDAGVAS